MKNYIFVDELEKRRKNQVIKWNFEEEVLKRKTDLLIQFFQRIGFEDDQEILFMFRHDVMGWVQEGTKTIKQIQQETIKNLSLNVMMKGNRIKKYVKTENENGVAFFFAAQGKRVNHEKIYVHLSDYDKGKEKRVFRNEQEAIKQYQTWLLQLGTEFEIVEEPKQEKNRYVVKAYRTKERIQAYKTAFLKKFKRELKTAMVFETANGFHIYWVIRDGSPARFKRIQEAINRKLDSDAQVNDLARMMRVPFFFHLKDPNNPFYVDVVHWGETDENGEWITYTQDELIDFLDLDVSEETETFYEHKTKMGKKEFIIKSSELALRKKFDIELSEEKMSFMEFVDEIKQVPLYSFFDNEEFENTEYSFNCHFHGDETPSATTYKMPDGKYMYRCYSDACAEQAYRSVIDLYIEMHSNERQEMTFWEAVHNLAEELDVELDLDEYQKKIHQQIALNHRFMKKHLGKRNEEKTKYPALQKYVTNPYIKILKELNDYILANPMKQEWSVDGQPIFFISLDYLSEDLEVQKSLIKKQMNMLCLLGFIEKLHFSDVPDSLYKVNEKGHVVNYYKMPFFDDIAKKAVAMVEKIKQSKLNKSNIEFEHIALALGLEEARRVFPNDHISTVKPKRKETNRTVRKKVEEAIEFMEEKTKETIRKKKYIKTNILINAVMKREFTIYSKTKGVTEKRHLYESEMNAVYKKFLVHMKSEGYRETKLGVTWAKKLKLKKPTGETIIIKDEK